VVATPVVRASASKVSSGTAVVAVDVDNVSAARAGRRETISGLKKPHPVEFHTLQIRHHLFHFFEYKKRINEALKLQNLQHL
jgi:hypothetical protein